MKKEIINEIVMPEGVEVNLDNNTIIVKGPKGEIKRTLLSKVVSMEKTDNKLVLKSIDFSRNGKKMVNTFTAHIRNMVVGVTEGYIYKLKVCSGHFPMTLKIDPDKILVNNFLGEKIPRKARIIEGANVKQDGDVLTVEGISKETVAQTAANIETSTRITNRDRRRFQDGIYITEKAGVPIWAKNY